MPHLTKESVAPKRGSSAGWMPERIGRWSVGVERRHPVTMRKVSFKALSMKRVCVLQHQTGAQYSALEQTKNRAAVRNVLAPAPHPDPASRLRSVTRVASFLRKVSKWWWNVSDLSGFTPR